MESLPDGAVDPRTGKVCGGYPKLDDAPEKPGRADGEAAGVVRRAPIIRARDGLSSASWSLGRPRWSMPLSLVCCSWSVGRSADDSPSWTVGSPSSFTGSPAGNPRVGVKVLVRRADRKGA